MMHQEQQTPLLESTSRFPPQKGVKLSYGTSGFRADASVLSAAVFRAGILAALRSLQTQFITGVMITTLHNQVYVRGKLQPILVAAVVYGSGLKSLPLK
ncbi:hypothetical protein Syun_011874 [Stephania yunnanensis]|uniref:Uncharacterized protein n=1 Tax=Stephania yunnanensis TaxID=152371 RepID=A0AAP0JZ45_9MAGN